MLQVFYELTPDVYTEMQTVRRKAFEVGQRCAVGETFVGRIPFDDPGGTLTIKGWRKFRVFETTATPPLLVGGRIRNKRVKRGDSDRVSLRTGADRWWDCDAIDQNTMIGARIARSDNAKRPAETAGERLAWMLVSLANFPYTIDNGHVTYPSDQLDANDYTGQTAADILSDCAQPGGYNFFIMETDVGVRELFFMLPTSSDWASSVSISDDLADYDGDTVFLPNYEASLEISDEIVAFGVYLPYNGTAENSYVYVWDDDIGTEFERVDRAAPMANVKTSAKATVIADRHLAMSASEDEHITCTVHVPASHANAIRPWHRIPYKSTWMPNFTTYRDCRVVQWSIEQQPFSDGGDGYLVHLELSPVEDYVPPAWSCPLDSGIAGTAAGTYPPLNGTINDADGIVWYTNSNHAYSTEPWDGPAPGVGNPGLGFASYGSGGSPDSGGANVSAIRFVVAGPGTAVFHMAGSSSYAATVFYHSAAGIQSLNSATSATGQDLTIVVADLPSDADGCYQWIDIGTNDGGAPTLLTFEGVTWTPA